MFDFNQFGFEPEVHHPRTGWSDQFAPESGEEKQSIILREDNSLLY